MVVKTIYTALTKAKPKKPPRLEKVIKTSAEAKTLLKQAQEKIQLKKEGKLDIKRPNEIVPKATDEILKDGQGITLPTKITKKDFIVQKPKVKEGQAQKFLDEEKRIVESTQPLKPKDIEGLNINKIRTSDDILRFVEIIARQEKLGAHKVQTWKETESLATLLNLSPEKLTANLLSLRPGKLLNAAEIRAAKRLLVSQTMRLRKIHERLKGESGNEFLAMEFAQQHALLTAITRSFKGAQVEVARAFNILRKTVQEEKVLGDINIKLDQLNRQNVLLELGGKEQIQKIAELMFRQPTISKQIASLEKSFGAKTSDAAVEVFLNNILIMTYTHIKNTGGNWIFKTMQRFERMYAANRYHGKHIDSVAEYEADALAFGEHMVATSMMKTLGSNLLKNFKANWSKPLKFYKKFPGLDSTIHGSKIEAPPNAFSAEGFGMAKDNVLSTAVDVFGRIMTMDRLSYKWLKNVDNYFKNGAFNGELYALAYRETIKQIKAGTLLKKDAADYLASLVVNPPPSHTQKAYEIALERTYQTQLKNRKDWLGSAAHGLHKFKTGINSLTWLTSQYFTFLRTPTNIAGAALERSPGLNRILQSYNAQLAKKGATAEIAKAKAAMGWAFLMTFVPLGYFGVFSGSDVMDPATKGRKEYPLREAANWQPKSFRFDNLLDGEFAEAYGLDKVGQYTGLTGDKMQINLTGFEPAVLIASVAADIGQIIRGIQDDWTHLNKKQDIILKLHEYVLAYALSIGENVGNSAFMQGTSRLMDLISRIKMSKNVAEPIGKELEKVGSTYVPYQFLLKQFNDLGQAETDSKKWGLRDTDDFRKLAYEFKSFIQRNIPGFENDLELDYDWLGDEMEKFGVLTTIKEHPVNAEARKINYLPTKIRKKIQVAIKKYSIGYPIQVHVELLENEYAQIEKFTGQEIKKELTKLMNSSKYQKEPKITVKRAMFAKVVEKAKTDVKENLKTNKKAKKIWTAILERADKMAKKKIKKDQMGFPIPEKDKTVTVGAMI